MRIISKQKDFYDYAASYGIDPSVVFIRTPRKVHIDRRNVDPVLKPFYIWPVDFSREKSCYVVHVLICGKAHRFFFVQSKEKNWYGGEEYVFKGFQSLDEALADCEADASDYNVKWKIESLKSDLPDLDRDWTHVNRHLETPIAVFGFDYDTPWRDRKNAVWSIDRDESIIAKPILNRDCVTCDAPILAMIGISSYLDGIEIWQSLSNWFSSGEPNMVELSNETKIVKAGFDKKTSFRNMDRSK